MKARYGWSDKNFTSLLQVVRDMLPEENKLPKSYYQEKKILCPMGMEYQKKDDDECNNDENSEKGPPTNVSKMLRKLVDGPKTNVITRQ